MPQEAIQYKPPSKEMGDKNNYCTMRLNYGTPFILFIVYRQWSFILISLRSKKWPDVSFKNCGFMSVRLMDRLLCTHLLWDICHFTHFILTLRSILLSFKVKAVKN
jgi:hypothetical protein